MIETLVLLLSHKLREFTNSVDVDKTFPCTFDDVWYAKNKRLKEK